MSRNTNPVGTFTISSAAGPSWATDSRGPQLQQHGEAVGGVPVVIDDQEPVGRRSGRLAAVDAVERRFRSSRGKRQPDDELAPLAQPVAVGLDACRRASPQGSSRASGRCPARPATLRRRGPPARTTRRCGAACPGRYRCRCPAPVTTACARLRLRREPKCDHSPRCTWRRWSTGCRAPGRAAPGRRPGQGLASGGKWTVNSCHALPSMSGGFHRTGDHRGQFHPLLTQFDLAPHDTGHVEQVVHQPDQLVDLPLHHLPCPLDGVAASTSALAGFARVADRGQRVAEFVGQRRQELVLAAVGVRQIGG